MHLCQTICKVRELFCCYLSFCQLRSAKRWRSYVHSARCLVRRSESRWNITGKNLSRKERRLVFNATSFFGTQKLNYGFQLKFIFVLFSVLAFAFTRPHTRTHTSSTRTLINSNYNSNYESKCKTIIRNGPELSAAN